MSKSRVLSKLLVPDPAVADTYLRRNSTNSVYEAKTPIQIVDEIAPLRDWRGRNVLFDGDMRLWPEGTSFTGRSAGSIYTSAQFMFGLSSSGTWTVRQVADHPIFGANGSCLEALVTTADGTVNSTDWVQLGANIEGYLYLPLYGQPQTLQFRMKGSTPGVYCLSLRPGDASESYVSEVTLNAPNVWELKTVTISGTPIGTGVWNFTDGKGLLLYLTLVAGTNFHPASLNAWETGNKLASANQVNLASAVNNYIRITDIQLEPGPVATPFERRPIQQELALCQRYFEKSFGPNEVPRNGPNSNEFADVAHVQSAVSSGNKSGITVSFKVPKRVSPSLTVYGNNLGEIYRTSHDGAGALWVSTNYNLGTSTTGLRIYYYVSSINNLWFHWAASARL